MNFKRTIFSHLLTWKQDKLRKPLIMRGARQVGKTTIIREFAKQYDNYILLNLEKVNDIKFFDENEDVNTIRDQLFLSHQIQSKDSVLLFIDEIQESPKAIQFLRYFYEEIPELHVIAAGSLLEFALKEVKSFPVGRVQFMYLHPCNFEEYLQAIGHEQASTALNQIPVKTFAHDILINLFHEYAIIGGMPEAIKNYAPNKDITRLPAIYESIWETYKNDVEKYASNGSSRKIIKHIMNTASLYLDERIKFQNFGNSNYRSREISEAFQNLDDAKIIQLIYPTTDTEVPVKPDLKKSPRMQFLDTGIVNHALGLQAELLSLPDLSNAFKGAIIPHLITQELISLNWNNRQKPNFWVREKRQSQAEVDLVYSYKKIVVPIEIKSGKVGTLKSLHQFIERTNHAFAIRICGGEFLIEKHLTPGEKKPYTLMSLPYYLGTQLPKYVEWFVEGQN
ncbi:ATP-binding protein [Crocinitomix catalasitica]|uniref:ATP-binding protein n=1 Tax=Crocinitomix catalasitica TaxID=184607 RepID=UPI000487E804|nr:AAA family ATPase [Crocinitomix catalasitica]